MKEKLFTIFGIAIFLTLCALGYQFLIKEEYFYTQIDNTKISNVQSSDEMKYQYKLVMYNEKGKSKEITFKTSRELREDAFLKVKYIYITGVNKWEEVQYSELPEKVRNKYTTS